MHSPFDDAEALELNAARMQHLEGFLGHDLSGKTVLDVGCGVGYFSEWFHTRGAVVTALDARADNLAELVRRHPGIRTQQWDLDRCEAAPGTGRLSSGTPVERFDIVLCYGLLYHLTNPLNALATLTRLCGGLLLVETILVDLPQPVLLLREECPVIRNQGLKHRALCPSMEFVLQALESMGCFITVQMPAEQPKHAEFDFTWKGDGATERDGHRLRRIFFAAR